MISIKLNKEYSLKGYSLIEAFPGAGLVGSMAGSYIIEKLKMEYIGHIESDMFPPIATIHNGIPMFPARIYKDDDTKVVLIIAEFTVPSEAIFQLSMELMNFIRKYGISKIVSISGMPSQKPSNSVYIASPDSALLKKAGNAGIKPIDEGVIAGISAIIMTNAEQFKIPTMNLLVEVNPAILDPRYAELAIAGLNKIMNMEIDLDDLEKEAKLVEAKIRSLQKKVKDTSDTLSGAAPQDQGPSMYA
ncbi:MAG: PAC2 family protein [Candidatus Micrarchaeaceae archaeon]